MGESRPGEIITRKPNGIAMALLTGNEAFLNTLPPRSLLLLLPIAILLLLVDLLEPVSHFLEAARESLSPATSMASDAHKATNFYCVPLQEFTPESGRYDVIWIQWCIGHLADDDFVSFFKRAKDGLKPGGLFVVKENIARNGFVLDNEDRSITRSDLYFKELFSRCGLHIYTSKDQKGFPEELFAVKMYALTTDVPKRVHGTRSKVHNRPAIIKKKEVEHGDVTCWMLQILEYMFMKLKQCQNVHNIELIGSLIILFASVDDLLLYQCPAIDCD
ncbi:Alpha-N-methyltransferase NTM1 [Dillenia turbinata]|uniref:Alpha N-terminal protein methyltransferase 1 n=1 Tax=Dillenia turbinata TaxID=194707 RepID=A0AAN8YVQ4_9MAGN